MKLGDFETITVCWLFVLFIPPTNLDGFCSSVDNRPTLKYSFVGQLPSLRCVSLKLYQANTKKFRSLIWDLQKLT